MSAIVNRQTGEIAEREAEEANAVAMLTQAIASLTDAVDATPISDVVQMKAKVATIQTATKELGMSKEAQSLAAEAVRRYEWKLARLLREGQDDGTIRSHGEKNVTRNQHGGVVVQHDNSKSSPQEFATRGELYGASNAPGILALADADADEFDAAIEAARQDGNLSRANVARKVQEGAGRPARATRRAALTDFSRDAADDLLRIAERFERIAKDDRFRENREAISTRAGGSLNRSLELLTQFRDALENNEATS